MDRYERELQKMQLSSQNQIGVGRGEEIREFKRETLPLILPFKKNSSAGSSENFLCKSF